jgi:RHS repeat-associated protein
LFDADTGLARFGARDYDPVVGRWISKDPIRFGGGQANLYTYGNNDPVNKKDPSGTTVWMCRRVAHLAGAQQLGLEHWWLMTDTVEAGMGACGGGVPGNHADSPYVTQTCVNDHSGEHEHDDVQCEPVGNVDEQCINNRLGFGSGLGPWSAWNQCQTFVAETLWACNLPTMNYSGAEGAPGY